MTTYSITARRRQRSRLLGRLAAVWFCADLAARLVWRSFPLGAWLLFGALLLVASWTVIP